MVASTASALSTVAPLKKEARTKTKIESKIAGSKKRLKSVNRKKPRKEDFVGEMYFTSSGPIK